MSEENTKEQLENMLEDVVNELDLSEGMIEEHGPLGTPPAKLVRLVLERKDREINMLRRGFVDISQNRKDCIEEAMGSAIELIRQEEVLRMEQAERAEWKCLKGKIDHLDNLRP